MNEINNLFIKENVNNLKIQNTISIHESLHDPITYEQWIQKLQNNIQTKKLLIQNSLYININNHNNYNDNNNNNVHEENFYTGYFYLKNIKQFQQYVDAISKKLQWSIDQTRFIHHYYNLPLLFKGCLLIHPQISNIYAVSWIIGMECYRIVDKMIVICDDINQLQNIKEITKKYFIDIAKLHKPWYKIDDKKWVLNINLNKNKNEVEKEEMEWKEWILEQFNKKIEWKTYRSIELEQREIEEWEKTMIFIVSVQTWQSYYYYQPPYSEKRSSNKIIVIKHLIEQWMKVETCQLRFFCEQYDPFIYGLDSYSLFCNMLHGYIDRWQITTNINSYSKRIKISENEFHSNQLYLNYENTNDRTFDVIRSYNDRIPFSFTSNYKLRNICKKNIQQICRKENIQIDSIRWTPYIWIPTHTKPIVNNFIGCVGIFSFLLNQRPINKIQDTIIHCNFTNELLKKYIQIRNKEIHTYTSKSFDITSWQDVLSCIESRNKSKQICIMNKISPIINNMKKHVISIKCNQIILSRDEGYIHMEKEIIKNAWFCKIYLENDIWKFKIDVENRKKYKNFYLKIHESDSEKLHEIIIHYIQYGTWMYSSLQNDWDNIILNDTLNCIGCLWSSKCIYNGIKWSKLLIIHVVEIMIQADTYQLPWIQQFALNTEIRYVYITTLSNISNDEWLRLHPTIHFVDGIQTTDEIIYSWSKLRGGEISEYTDCIWKDAEFNCENDDNGYETVN